MSTSTGKIDRKWIAPTSLSGSGLMLYNSLLDEKVPFIPASSKLGGTGKDISWYTCGPTVYDVAHVGHARNYLTFDIIRRVLEDYFGYNVLFVMNVTDVDDKIILRARRNHLLNEYKAKKESPEQVKTFALEAVESSKKKQEAKHSEAVSAESAAAAEGEAEGDKTARRKKEELEVNVKNEAHKLQQIVEAQAKILAVKTEEGIEAVFAAAGDYIAESLDKRHGSSVTDESIFRAHAARYEADFFQDMEALGCRPPDVLTRVSEYIPEIVQFVERIVGNGMAYSSNGSVYFDTRSFTDQGHTYGKLKPWAVGSALLAAEGESNFETSEKRTATDFALWKASKPGEPAWDSPWGKGRPGWHIECSAMASSIIGSKMDIHSGGEDLRFPHHDNELAQSEAYYHHEGCCQWVNYFLHSGHLEIEGLKMSKSLKNFITIKEALTSYTPRQLRLMFTLQPWHKSMMYGEGARAEMKAREAQIKNFFQNVDVATRGIQQTTSIASWAADEKELGQKIQDAQVRVHERLCDNIDTAGAMDAISDLIKSVNSYLSKKEASGPDAPPQPLLLRKATAFVTRILSVFGIVPAPSDSPGLGDIQSSSGDGKVASYLDAFAAFRDEIRTLARSKAELKDILSACDKVRDGTLVDLGVRLEDKSDGKAVWKLDDPATMRAEQEERAKAAAEQAMKKLSTQLTLKEKEKEKFEKLISLPSVEVSLSEKYGKFDLSTGEPTHNKEGVALEGKSKDKAMKDFEKAKKVLEPLSKKLIEDPGFMEKLSADIAEIQSQLKSMSVQP